MDFIDFTPLANPSRFPSVSASPASPKTLHHVHQDITYANIGAGWVPVCQESSGSVYSGYTSLPAATKTNVVANLTATAPTAISSPAQAMKAVKTADVLVRGR